MDTRLPVVAIVGRPNVGKSSLFNSILGQRSSIVDERAGVTRDRLSAEVNLGGRMVQIVDTGGIGIVDSDELEEDIEVQIAIAIDQADVVVFLVDARAGLTPYDEKIAERLRSSRKRTILGVNKCDSYRQEYDAAEFYKLGFGDAVKLVATERRGRTELLERIARELDHLPPIPQLPPTLMKVAFTGRRNVGKSTLINTLAGENRVIVSDVPGTTRDAVDVVFNWKGCRFVGIDTAGMRKHHQIKDDIEFYSLTRALEAIKRADVVFHILDAPSELSQVDKKLSETVREYYKPCVFLVNKMDLVPGTAPREFERYVRETMPWVACSPVVMISALKGTNVERAVETAIAVNEQARTHVATSDLNRAIQAAIVKRRPPKQGSRFAKLYYATQVGVQPPTIALFVNDPDSFDEPYLRYLEHELQTRLPYTNVPLKFYVRARSRPEQ